ARDQARRIQHASGNHMFSVSAPANVQVCADRVKVEAVLVNLFGNAVKYSPAGGRIDVELQTLDEEVELSVSDRGIGLEERDLENLFEQYGRGDNAVHQGIAGHGLGLFICRRIVEAHGGHIYARSTPGGGSRFAFTLPLP